MEPTQAPFLYLLSGNGSIKAWWDDTLPFFRTYEPVPLELPGFGDNPSDDFHSLGALADALIDMTQPGQDIFAAGVNGLVALHALVRRPGHFKNLYLMAPVGAFLWKRRFVKLMRPKPIRATIHYLLRNRPKTFAKKFSSKTWTDAQYARMGEGYAKCRAFQTYFDIVQPVDAIDLFEYIRDRVVLIWGRDDAVLGLKQAAAWDSILARAQMEIIVKENWEHYPYIDDPEEFAHFMESNPQGFRAHSKAGRLQLAHLAGLPVPQSQTVTGPQDIPQLKLKENQLYAVRSSGANEDQADHSNAGRNRSFLRVKAAEVPARTEDLLGDGLAEVAVQEFIEPKISGVAFARGIGVEVEMVEGHNEALVSGTVTPARFIWSKMGQEWAEKGEPSNIPGDGPEFREELRRFLQQSIAAFHFTPADIEWAWDGQQFHLLQTRPVTAYDWRRALTSANLDEILPRRVSRLMEHAQQHAAASIGRLYALWDPRTLDDGEPFSVPVEGASYINLDLFLSRFRDWGLPSQLLAREIGGAVPKFGIHPGRFFISIPRLLKMQRVIRKEIRKTGERLQAFEQDLDRLLVRNAPETHLVNWFTRFYIFIVRQNMVINACLSAAGGSFWGKGKTVYRDMAHEQSAHRLQFESDPATPRPEVPLESLRIAPFPADQWNGGIRFLNGLGAPGLGGFYFEIREWFRDNNMKLFHRLHLALRGSEWLPPHDADRTRSGTFWQDGGGVIRQGHGFTIYNGEAEGIVGEDILVVDALEPGHFEAYKAAKAVVARTGGRLSHGSTLLRELKKPSAIIPDAPELTGRRVRFHNGALEEVEG